MLKFEYGNGCKIFNDGTIKETVNGCCTLIHEVYCTLAKRDPIMAVIFRDAILEIVNSEKSPMWDMGAGGNPDLEIFFMHKKRK